MSTGPYKLGLTGSIGMGKSTLAGFFRNAGVPVWDADATVHALYAPGGAGSAAVGALCPDCVGPQGVNRAALAGWIAAAPGRLALLEKAIHPLVKAARLAFLHAHRHVPLVVLDIPLLFETGAEAECDGVLVVTAAPEVQRARVLARPGMSEARLNALLARQMPDAEKRARADFVIESKSLGQAHAEVEALLSKLQPGAAHA
jgi:dephospho-CoA kinase